MTTTTTTKICCLHVALKQGHKSNVTLVLTHFTKAQFCRENKFLLLFKSITNYDLHARMKPNLASGHQAAETCYSKKFFAGLQLLRCWSGLFFRPQQSQHQHSKHVYSQHGPFADTSWTFPQISVNLTNKLDAAHDRKPKTTSDHHIMKTLIHTRKKIIPRLANVVR